MPNEGRGGHMAISSAKSVKFHKGEAADGGDSPQHSSMLASLIGKAYVGRGHKKIARGSGGQHIFRQQA